MGRSRGTTRASATAIVGKKSSSIVKKARAADKLILETTEKLPRQRLKPPKSSKPRDNPQTTFVSSSAEIDFPRGGGSGLSAVEHAKALREGVLEAEEGLGTQIADGTTPTRKRRLNSKPSDSPTTQLSKKHKQGLPRLHKQNLARIEHLNPKRLVPGLKLAGVVVQVRPLEVIVALPRQLLGHIPITHVSSYYTERLKELAGDEEQSERTSQDSNDAGESTLKGLDQLFQVGQWIQCCVVKTSDTPVQTPSRVSALVKTALKVTLTVDPYELNSGLLKSDLCSGMMLSGAVKSVEDKGYIMDFGVSINLHQNSSTHDRGRTVTAFVPFEAPSNSTMTYPPTRWEIGETKLCRVKQMAENGITCCISVDKNDISSAALTNASTVDTILPLHLVKCVVTTIVPGQGLQVTFLGYFKGVIDISHIPLNKQEISLDEAFQVGQKLLARVLWHTLPTRASLDDDSDGSFLEPKIFGLSLLEHVKGMAFAGLPCDLITVLDPPPSKISQILRFGIGHTFQSVRVETVVDGWGLYVRCLDEEASTVETKPGFVHVKNVSDSHLKTLPSNTGPYRAGTTHKARVIGVSPIDGILQLSLQPSVIEKAFLGAQDVQAGAFVVGEVKELKQATLIISTSVGVDCIVPPDHYSDLKLSNPEKKFKPGVKVRARVLYSDPDTESIVLTLRKTLLHPSLEIITSYGMARPGMVTYATVRRVFKARMVVEFFGKVRATVPISEAAQGFTASMSSLFTPGQLVKVKVTKADVPSRQVTASVRLALPPENKDGSKDNVFCEPAKVVHNPKASTPLPCEGDNVFGLVSKVDPQNIILLLKKEGSGEELAGKGLISTLKLAKHRNMPKEDLVCTLSPGEHIADLVVRIVRPDKELSILSFKPSTSAGAPLSEACLELSLGQTVTGTISAVHEQNVALSLQPDGCKDSEPQVRCQGLLSIPLLAGHRKTSPLAIKKSLSQGDKISKLIVKKINQEKGLVIVGFPRPAPHSPSINCQPSADVSKSEDVPKVGEIMEVFTASKSARGLHVRPVDMSDSRWTFLIDFPDIHDDFDAASIPEPGSRLRARIVQVDGPGSRVYLSTRPSLLFDSSTSSGPPPVKDRRISSSTDLRGGDRIRGFVYKLSQKSGLMVKIGTNLTAKVFIKQMDEPDWSTRFSVGRVVLGQVILPTKCGGSLMLDLRKAKLSSLSDMEVGQKVLTTVERIVDYGLFLQVIDTKIRGLCHRSQVSDEDLSQLSGSDWLQGFSTGMKLKASVLAVSPQDKRISFTIKPTLVGEQVLSPSRASLIMDGQIEAAGHSNSSAPASSASTQLLTTANENIPLLMEMVTPSLPCTGFNWGGLQPHSGTESAEDINDSDTGSDTENDGEDEHSAKQNPQSVPGLAILSSEEIEKLISVSPNSSEHWIRLVHWHISRADLPQARKTVQRALDAINYREEGEKWKVWVARLDLENTYGTAQQMEDALAEATTMNNPKTVWLEAARIFYRSGKLEEADSLYRRTVKKFRQSSKAWCQYGEFCLTQGRASDASELLGQSLKSLPARKQVKTILKFAQLGFGHGDIERARTLLEGLVATHPKRSDIWIVYLDWEIKAGAKVENVRGLFMRTLSQNLSTRCAKLLLNKWLQYERRHGDPEGRQLAIQRAQDYVFKALRSSAV